MFILIVSLDHHELVLAIRWLNHLDEIEALAQHPRRRQVHVSYSFSFLVMGWALNRPATGPAARRARAVGAG